MTFINDKEESRREFLKTLATAAGAVVLMPMVSSCSGPEAVAVAGPTEQPTSLPTQPAAPKMAAVPITRPAAWDPIAFNRTRGNAGAIPESYWPSINGPDGKLKHLGKHLPYLPAVDPAMVPAGFIALMWGDPDKGYAKHPNAPKSDAKPHGHWYNWITVRKAVEGEASEVKSTYPDWPGDKAMLNTSYAVFGGGADLMADGGRNTIYLAALPKDVVKGDLVRVYAHCLTHGEYVDFLTIA